MRRFSTVFARELEHIRKARNGQAPRGEITGAKAAGQAEEMKLKALALSGGGIRSATFCLGIIQALCERGLLKCFDYLSTVSGGGYIGSWLSAQIHHLKDIDKVQAALSPTDKHGRPKPNEDKSIEFLRQYSNYLTPHKGPLSIDTLAAVATYVRNFIVTQSTLITLIIAILLVPRVLDFLVQVLPARTWEGAYFSCAGWTGLLLVGVSLAGIWFNVRASPASRTARTPFVVWVVIVPAFLGAFAISIALAKTSIFPWKPLLLLVLAYATLSAMLALLPATRQWRRPWRRESSVPHGKPSALRLEDRSTWIRFWQAFWIFVFAFVAGACGLLSLWLLQDLMKGMYEDAAPFAVSVAPFLTLQVFALVVVIHLGLVGRVFDYQVHEWWSNYGAWVIEVTVWAGGAAAVAVYGPRLFEWAVQLGHQAIVAAGGAVWIITTLWGVLKGASPSTSGTKTTWVELFLPLAPYVFIFGLALALAAVIHPGLTTGGVAVAAFLVFSAAHLVLSLRLDVNLFSLHGFYRNRLTRCYLGGARMSLEAPKRRKPHPFTGFDPRDDIELQRLAEVKIPIEGKEPPEWERRAIRPYHLINTTLNINAGKNVASQQRKAASFFFSPLYCGFEFPEPENSNPTAGFMHTEAYMRDTRGLGATASRGAMLGSAMAVSGAALNPNGAFHVSRPVAFLLTLFNVRLGRWCPNPAHFPVAKRQAPRLGGWVMVRELFALTDAESAYVYLSDGGHFDNLGVYELVRRRARLVVAVDCGEDADGRFDDIAETIRKCYIDFGARITLDVGELAKSPHAVDPKTGAPLDPLAALCKVHFAEGTIEYPALEGAPAFTGTLVLVKPTLTAQIFKEAPDLLNYYLSNAEFPQQSTTDQWFNEAQFESYRKLGYLIGGRLLKDFKVDGQPLTKFLLERP
jgi:predicted acylesterase/phospholipase RssA